MPSLRAVIRLAHIVEQLPADLTLHAQEDTGCFSFLLFVASSLEPEALFAQKLITSISAAASHPHLSSEWFKLREATELSKPQNQTANQMQMQLLEFLQGSAFDLKKQQQKAVCN